MDNKKLVNLQAHTFKQLKSLKLLYLGSCEISAIPNRLFTGMNHLEVLDLNNNQIVDITSLSKLVKLWKLFLAGNKIKNIDSLSDLTDLDHLDLSENEITEIPKSINNLEKLITLNIDINQLKEVDNLKLQNLRVLFLSHNEIQSLPNINKLINLETLFIDFNKLKSINQICDLKKLTWIQLNNNKIENIDCLFQMPSLTNIEAKNNKIKGKVYLNESSNSNLSTLRLSLKVYHPSTYHQIICRALRVFIN